MSYFGLIDHDLILKIFDIRCNEIEIDIFKLENNNFNIVSYILNKIIYLKHEIEEENTDYKYNIYKNMLYLDIIDYDFLYNIIYNGKVIFLYYHCDYINKYPVIKSDIIINPNIIQLIQFKAKIVEIYSSTRYIEGFNILTDIDITNYHIDIEEGIIYIEMIT
jgi:hypothetical protein